jgi:DNA replication protein DnaC
MVGYKLLIIDELGFVPLSKTGAELLFELISQADIPIKGISKVIF